MAPAGSCRERVAGRPGYFPPNRHYSTTRPLPKYTYPQAREKLDRHLLRTPGFSTIKTNGMRARAPTDHDVNQSKDHSRGDHPETDHNRHHDHAANEGPAIPTSPEQDNYCRHDEKRQNQSYNNTPQPRDNCSFQNSIKSSYSPE